MRIACLQFSPQVGDIDNNLNRADAVLNKAKPEELQDLDLLVLPEMAFSGYNFKSLHQIHPFLEPSGSGISSLWARTTALKFNTNVLVGYPEQVDVRHKWPASPEYYDSAIMVNGDGENVLNYRKRFLYKTDETWALEGDSGFYDGDIPGLGKTVVGICMDLNPYRFESPWNAFEFGFHALEVEPDLIVVTMSWVTRQEHRDFSRMLAEPDMETLTYWVQRLEPLISAELEREIIVVFCNRCGQEDESLYAGTSAIIGIKGGEVNVYALAGRGTKEFLMADTSKPPFAKLIQGADEPVSPGLTTWPPTPTTLPPPTHSAIVNATTVNSIAPPRGPLPPPPLITTSNQPRRDRPSPKIQIPDFGTHAFSGGVGRRMGTVSESPNTIPTPEAPSPTPLAIRPKLIIPGTESPFGDSRKPSPYPHDDFLSQQFRFFGRQHQPFTPVPPEQDPAQSRYYWRPSDTLLNTPLILNWAASSDLDDGPKINDLGPLTPYPGSDLPPVSRIAKHNAKAKEPTKAQPAISERPGTSREHTRSDSRSPPAGMPIKAGRDEAETTADSLETSGKVAVPPQRASSPKQQSESTPSKEPRGDPKVPQHSDISPLRERDAVAVHRPGSVSPDSRPSWTDDVKSNERGREPRPKSPKSRHTSRNGSRTGSVSREYGAYGRRPSDTPVNGIRSVRDGARSGSSRPPSRRGWTAEGGEEIMRPGSRTTDHHVVNEDSGRVVSPSPTEHATEKSSPEMAGVTLPKLATRAQSPGGRFDEARPISRGRQRWTARDPPPPYSETENNRLLLHVQVKQPPKQAQSTTTPLVPRQVSITRIQCASGLVGIRFATPDDEIIAIEEYIDPICDTHGKRSASASAISHKIPSIEDGRAIVGIRANLPPPPPLSALCLADDSDDRRVAVFRTPSVLGGFVKTTIVDVPYSRTDSGSGTESGVSILTPPLSAVFEMMSPTTPFTGPTSGSNTPSARKFDLTPRPTANAQFAKVARRIDTPFPPLACINCNHGMSLDQPLKTGPLERVRHVEGDLPKELFADWVVTDAVLKRRSW